MLSGEGKGESGVVIGKHGLRAFQQRGSHHGQVHFEDDVLDMLAIGDKMQVKACGVGFKMEGFDDVRFNKLSPRLLQNMGISVEDRQLVVPIAKDVPGFLMGSGIGSDPCTETNDYDIQTTCPEYVDELGLKEIRLGDVVAIRDHYCSYGRGRYEGATTIGVVIHGWSDSSGHGPGVNSVISAYPGRIKTRLDPHADIAYYLGLRKKP